MSSIKAAERMGEEDAAAADATRKEYLAAAADGSVRRIQGDPSYGAIMPQAEDNTWDALKKKRLAEMKLAAQQRQAWRELGHGSYTRLESESRFLEELPKHERAVCHLYQPGSVDGGARSYRVPFNGAVQEGQLASSLERLSWLLQSREGAVPAACQHAPFQPWPA